MDKYVLVPQDRYDNMLRNEKNTPGPVLNKNQSEAVNTNIISPPPPGLPAADEIAKNGIELSNQEAEKISETLMDIALNNTKNLVPVGKFADSNKSSSNKKEQPTSWKALWEPVSK